MSSIDIRTLVTPMPVRAHAHGHTRGTMGSFARNPMLVYWEMTQACGLACRHCRAEAVSMPHPNELTAEEGSALLRQIASFDHPPHMVMTGGDPLRRVDLYDRIDEARSLGITVSVTPSATSDLTPEVLAKLQAHGIDSLGLSLDGPTAESHEAVRGVEGCFGWTIAAAREAGRLGIPIQVNTLVSQETIDGLPAMYELVKDLGVMRWSLFFLIETGRGKLLQPVSNEIAEKVMNWAYDLSQIATFAVATTEAPSYRRVALDRMRTSGMTSTAIEETPVYRGFGIRDGHGILFISNQGDICPAGFLPLAVGNVRTHNLVEAYRNSLLFQALHNPAQFHGKCGVCEFAALCGGSRARAFAATGDPLGSDPLCSYEPKGYERQVA